MTRGFPDVTQLDFTNLNRAPPIELDTNAAITLTFLLGSATALGASTFMVISCIYRT
jgi:hypothetical protein